MNYFMWQDAPAIYCFAMPVMDWTYSTPVHALVPKLWRYKNAKKFSCTRLARLFILCPPFIFMVFHDVHPRRDSNSEPPD